MKGVLLTTKCLSMCRDAVSTERAVELAANTKGICYIRTSRPNTAVIYNNDETFKVIILHLVLCFWDLVY